ncbi:unnamed protein product [Paramecium primaurelia]|uniref:Uncharacterized protein n=1 Tax=Paramecium primaurelia TaxID=5886 RepID=A0A8S1NUX0_PARPR|nr:unnamed protein product [Paramecium primaurelia]
MSVSQLLNKQYNLVADHNDITSFQLQLKTHNLIQQLTIIIEHIQNKKSNRITKNQKKQLQIYESEVQSQYQRILFNELYDMKNQIKQFEQQKDEFKKKYKNNFEFFRNQKKRMRNSIQNLKSYQKNQITIDKLKYIPNSQLKQVILKQQKNQINSKKNNFILILLLKSQPINLLIVQLIKDLVNRLSKENIVSKNICLIKGDLALLIYLKVCESFYQYYLIKNHILSFLLD